MNSVRNIQYSLKRLNENHVVLDESEAKRLHLLQEEKNGLAQGMRSAISKNQRIRKSSETSVT